VVVVRVTPSLPQRGCSPRGDPLVPLLVQSFQLTTLPGEGQTKHPSDPPKGGNARKIQKTSFVNRWFKIKFQKLFKIFEFIQPSRISTKPIITKKKRKY
jgi:hypothetical protein